MKMFLRIAAAVLVLLAVPKLAEAGAGHPTTPVQGTIQVTPGWQVTEIRVSYTDPNGNPQSHAETVNNHLAAQKIEDAKAAAGSGLGVTVYLDKIPDGFDNAGNPKFKYEYVCWMQHLPGKGGKGGAPQPK